MEFKHVEIMCVNKRLDEMDKPAKGIYKDTYKVCLQELKKHYFPKNSAQLQNAYLCNHVKKPNKLLIKNTTVQLRKVNSMLTHFPAPKNNPMVEDELCNIMYLMVKHDWQDALQKSGRAPTNISSQDLVNYFEQIELLDGVKQKSEAIVIDDDSDKKKKSSSHCRKNENSDEKAKVNQPKGSHNSKRVGKY
eukprot:9558064-Ditylum_brightwellii.AAC.1